MIQSKKEDILESIYFSFNQVMTSLSKGYKYDQSEEYGCTVPYPGVD